MAVVDVKCLVWGDNRTSRCSRGHKHIWGIVHSPIDILPQCVLKQSSKLGLHTAKPGEREITRDIVERDIAIRVGLVGCRGPTV